MTAPLIAAIPGHEGLAERLASAMKADIASIEFRRFPDGEHYVRFNGTIAGRTVIIACTLDRPDDKVLPLLFSADCAKELGAARVGLVAPYLSYLRQDRRFKPGEALTSATFARLLSHSLDWLITIDPHLHRINSLDAIYSIPTRTVHAASAVAQWIRQNVASPLLIGPDAESDQWVGSIAADAKAPYIVLQKIRRGDRDVEVSVPDIERWPDHTPVIADDIISSAATMAKTVAHLRSAGMKPAICIGVHAVFAQGAYELLRSAGAARVVTTNTIPHETNAIDVTPLLVEATREMI